MSIIEVVVRDFTMMLPLRQGATISSVTQEALQEYASFNLRAAPKKVLFAKDSKGRVLSSALTFPLPHIEGAIEIVVEDYSDKDAVSPAECERLFRDWQRWAINQLKEHVQHLTFREQALSPDKQVMTFLTELSKSPDEDVQLAALRVFRLVLSKCVDKDVIVESAELISRMFVTTQSADVAINALDSFKDLSPLQLKLFNSGKYVGAMIDVNKHLTRFSPDVQGKLFTAFQSILSIINDEDLNQILQKSLSTGELDGEGKLSADSWIQILQENQENPIQTVTQKASSKGFNVGRLQGLLDSEDIKIRRYSLEKLKKNLKALHEAYNSSTEKTTLEEIGDVPESTSKPPQSPRDQSLQQKHSANEKPTGFKNEMEVEALAKALFQCIKNSIQARPKKSKLPENEEIGIAEKQQKTLNTNHSDAVKKGAFHNNVLDTGASSKLSMAGKLITSAFQSQETDRQSVDLCIDCLSLLFFLPQDIEEGELTKRSHIKNRKINPLTARRLSNIQKLIMVVARDWYRLLFTLSHVDEACSDPFLTEIAEKSANIFSMTIIHGMKQGWAASALQLEKPALSRFLFVQTPTYRLYMALTYLTHLTTVSKISGSNNKVIDPAKTEIISLNKQTSESSTGDVLSDILAHNKFMLLKSLWWWSIGERSNFLIRRMALKCIAKTTVSSTFAQFLWKLDPMPR